MTQKTTPGQRLRHLEDRAEGQGLEVHKREGLRAPPGYGPDEDPWYQYRWVREDGFWHGAFETYREALEYALGWDGRMPDEEPIMPGNATDCMGCEADYRVESDTSDFQLEGEIAQQVIADWLESSTQLEYEDVVKTLKRHRMALRRQQA